MAKRFHRRSPRRRVMHDGGRRIRRRRSYGFRRRLKDKTFPLSLAPAIAVPIGTMFSGDGQLMGIGKAITTYLPSGDWSNLSKEVTNSISRETIGFTPYNGQWDFGIVARNVGLMVGGLIVHKIATKVGINRKMKNIPFIGKYVSI